MSRPKKYTTIRITIDTAKELRKYEGELQAQTGDNITDDQAISALLSSRKEAKQ